jgi:Icc-related predicted phosphoesterase
MRVLIVSDQIAPQLYDATIKTNFSDVDLVLSCGDLPHYYLEYIVTMLNVPLYYVMGNHGFELECSDSGERRVRPEGCIDINDRVVESHGLSIAGLEGSLRYKNGPYQYTQAQMRWKAMGLAMKLLGRRLRTGRWLDILLTHAPPFGIQDGKDLSHTGFRAFVRLMQWLRPRYLIHGHSHDYSRLQSETTLYRSTTVVNVFPYRLLDIQSVHSHTEASAP